VRVRSRRTTGAILLFIELESLMKPSSDKNQPLSNEAHELISDISQLMAEAEEMLNESTSHHAEEKIALLAARYEPTEKRFMEKYLTTKEKLSTFARRTDDAIRACPYESLAIALGIGVLLGATLRRRGSGRTDG
jgi:ElaB/YqjD/DUF883 family membrane-anchored ribosome-binding protein